MTDPKVTQTRSTFSLTCRVENSIDARPERIWSLLTDAKDFARWNSTVTGIDGRITDGERIRIQVPGTSRTPTLRISGVVPPIRMTWTGGTVAIMRAVRTFELTSHNGDSTFFIMEERLSGLLLPLVGRSLPDFGPIFETFASDLKREAERATP
jgi:hypothetical protein